MNKEQEEKFAKIIEQLMGHLGAMAGAGVDVFGSIGSYFKGLNAYLCNISSVQEPPGNECILTFCIYKLSLPGTSSLPVSSKTRLNHLLLEQNDLIDLHRHNAILIYFYPSNSSKEPHKIRTLLIRNGVH